MRSRSKHWAAGMVALAMLSGAVPTYAATNIFAAVHSGASAYRINGVSNPDLRLVRGFSYTFNLNASGHPFWIKTIQGPGTGNGYNDGVTGNGTAVGAVQFAVPTNAPSPLFYNCQFHTPMTGMLILEDAPLVQITTIHLGTNLVLTSTGTDALNIMVESRSNLVNGTWLSTAVITNEYADGTNTTQIAVPPPVTGFVRVSQGFP